ncbi:signal recognition particle-docking protein FtsY [Verrucomicrobia bacterium LW23]|nr:signal recognition particle-docking protein FtsY [Verrucomicrobia bacterium LW23]
MSFWKRLITKFFPPAGGVLDWEALLLEADLGLTLTMRLVEMLEKQALTRDIPRAQQLIREELYQLLKSPPPIPVLGKPFVILMVGVNGSGKTTTISKLTKRALGQEKSVYLGAADTFRAAAVDQLQVWADRLNVPIYAGAQGADPASVAFKSYEAATAAGSDVLLIDTAGRQANKSNLMLELGKVKRIIQRKNEEAPHQIWLVVDGSTGSNVLSQAKEFHEAVGLTGLIMTKLDGSAKGGMIAAVKAELGLSTLYLGRGETPDALEPFHARRYVEEFFGDGDGEGAAAKGGTSAGAGQLARR